MYYKKQFTKFLIFLTKMIVIKMFFNFDFELILPVLIRILMLKIANSVYKSKQ